MLYAKEYLDKLTNAGIQAFESEYILDFETDIILSNGTIENFIRYCQATHSTVAFYTIIKYEEPSLSIDDIRKELELYAEHELASISFVDSVYFQVSDFSSDIEEVLTSCQNELKLQKETIAISKDSIKYLEIYTIQSGCYVGISLVDDETNTESFSANMILENAKQTLDSAIHKQTDPYDRFSMEYQKRQFHERLAKEKKQAELLPIIHNKIYDYVKDDPEMLLLTNKTKRHSYAKQLVSKFSKEYDIKLIISDVEAIVEEVYSIYKMSK